MTYNCRYCPHAKISHFVTQVIETCTHPSLAPPRQIQIMNRASISRPPAVPTPDWCPLSAGSGSGRPQTTRILEINSCYQCPHLGSFARRVCKKWPYTDENGYELLRPIDSYPRIPDWCPLEKREVQPPSNKHEVDI